MLNRKKREKGQKNIDSGSLFSKNEQEKFLEFLKFQNLSEKLKKKYEVSTSNLIKQIEDDILIPITIFSRELGSLETICKYLKENLNLKNRKIAFLIARDSRSVWQAYNASKKKLPSKYEIFPSKYFIPVSILRNKELSVLENIVFYLKEEFSLNYHEIAVLLKRDDRTIWSVYQKARKKNVKK